MIDWFWHKIIPSCFGFWKFDISTFCHILHSFFRKLRNSLLWINPFQIFFSCFFSSVSMSMNAFNQGSWLNLYYIRCVHSHFSSCKWATSFSTLSFFSPSGKTGKSLWRSCNFSEYWTSISRKYLSSLHAFFISNQNFEKRLGHAYDKSLSRVKVCLHYAYSLKFYQVYAYEKDMIRLEMCCCCDIDYNIIGHLASSEPHLFCYIFDKSEWKYFAILNKKKHSQYGKIDVTQKNA